MSVITIFYNAEAFLSEAIQSVLAQDFPDFEYLLVDDGSTDASTALAKSFAAADKRIRYLEHPNHANRGMSAARNLGVSEARGDFIAFIDADDRWQPEKLTEQVKLLDQIAEADAVGGSVNYWASHEGGQDRVVKTGHVQHRLVPPGQATIQMYPLGKSDAPSMSDLMFRRESILNVGGFEESFRGAYEDQAFLSKFYLASSLYFTDRLWSDYRIHDRSCMAEVNKRGSYDEKRRGFLEWFKSYIDQTPFAGDIAILESIERALLPYRGTKARLRSGMRRFPGAVGAARIVRKAYEGLRPIVAPGPVILMYHRIAVERFDPWQMAVSPANFAAHLEWLARNRTPLPLQEFAELHAAGRLPSDAVAITFDDAYACAAEVAAPMLRQLGIPATIFASPKLIDRNREFWWDEIERIVLSHPGEALRVGQRVLIIGARSHEDSDWPTGAPARTARQKAYKQLWSLLYGRPLAEIEEILNGLRDQAGVSAAPRQTHRLLTAEEVRRTASNLITFGSHALTHPSLSRLSVEERKREIFDSVEQCANLTGERPTTFAYPFGDYAEELEQLVSQSGFVCACRADGWFVTRKSRQFALPRLFVGNWDAGQLALRLGRP